MRELVLNHSLHDHQKAGILSGCQTHYGAIYEKPKLETHELYQLYRTPSGEIFGHSRSRSHCFQVQSVTWCWGPWLFLWVWSIFHILLSKGMVTLRKFLEFQLVIPQTLICNRNRFCTQSISLNHSVADLLAPRLGEICNLLCVSLHWDQTWTYRRVDRYQIFTPILQWRLRMTWMRSGLQDPVLPRSVRVNGLSANFDWCFGKCPYFYYSR